MITAIVNNLNICKIRSVIFDVCIGIGINTFSALIDGIDTVYCCLFITVYNQQYLDKLFKSNTILSSITIVWCHEHGCGCMVPSTWLWLYGAMNMAVGNVPIHLLFIKFGHRSPFV
jgi:hypothetical protein